ncbi:MAG: ATP-binding cassette domain-containing protein, partial [Bacteroidota bacterium]
MGRVAPMAIGHMFAKDVASEAKEARGKSVRLGVTIRVEAVTKKFRLTKGDDLVVFSNFNLDIDSGSFVAILGPSGCGKSTLLRLIAGLESLDDGRIVLGDGTAQGRPRVGLMLQQYTSLPWLTVGQNIGLALGSRDASRDGGRFRERIPYYLSRVGLFGWQDAYPRELSGGMLQRLALARTLAMEPDVVLLDEPFGALDALTRRDLQGLIRDLHKAEPRTFVMVTHDVNDALAVADRLVVLGPAGTGILYDSATTDLRLDHNGLVRLLQGTHVTFAAGTWSGYAPVHQASIERGTRVYEFWLGMSDQERCTALRSGRVAGAFFTLQALVSVLGELVDIDPVVVHVFTRQVSLACCEHILIRLHTRADGTWRWALPGSGLEMAVVQRIDREAFPHRIIMRTDRADCVLAIIRGEADACVTDIAFARQLIPWWRRLCLRWL